MITKLLQHHLHHPYTKMNHLPASNFPVDRPTSFAAKCWLDDACIVDIDHFVKTLSGIKSKGVRPDLIGSIITHYACKWIPELSTNPQSQSPLRSQSPQQSPTASWLKKRFFIETIVSVLPPENDAVPCSFLLRLLKTANMVGVDSNFREEVENRVALQLDQATLKDVMIPSFSHVRGTLFDVELMTRLVKMFVEMDIESLRSGVGMLKVAKLVDAYLAEIAVDSELGLMVFMELAGAIPAQARATDDGLYRAIDTYIKMHVNMAKEERKMLCHLINIQKLSTEASLHVTQNERMPVRCVIQVLSSEQAKLHSHIDWSTRSFSNSKSPIRGLDRHDWSHSTRDVMTLQHMEIKKLKENVTRLERQCHSMIVQIDKLSEKKKRFFSWRKLGISTSTNLRATNMEVGNEKVEEGYDSCSIGKQTPLKGKQARCKTRNKSWRQSMP